MKRFNLLAFGFVISRHRTKALAVTACERRITALRKAYEARKYAQAACFDYEVRLGQRCIYARGGWA